VIDLVSAPGVTPPAWDPGSPETEVWLDSQGRECAYGSFVGDECWMHVRGIGSFRLEEDGVSAAAVPMPDVPIELVEDTYYRTVLPMALQMSGREVLHASAVVTPQGVLALCAVSETGKSTLAYALMRHGNPLYADDAVVFEMRGEAPGLVRIPFAVRLRSPSAIHFGTASKEQVMVVSEPAPAVASEFPMSAICVLERLDALERHPDSDAGEPGATAVVNSELLSPAAAFTAVLPHAYCFTLRNPERKALMMRQYFRLVAAVPVYRVRFRPGLHYLPAIVDELERLLEPRDDITANETAALV
jgi:hypothetical protein